MDQQREAREWEAQRATDAREQRAREEQRAMEAREHAQQALAHAEEQAFKVNNPGDYDCPSCLLQTLKRGARRCPKCHSDVDDGFWPKIQAAEAAAAKAEREARERREERTRQEQKARDDYAKSPAGIEAARARAADEAEAERVRAAAQASANWATASLVAFFLGIGLSCVTLGMLVGLSIPIWGVGFILGVISLKGSRSTGRTYAAIGTNLVGLAVWAAFLVVFLLMASK